MKIQIRTHQKMNFTVATLLGMLRALITAARAAVPRTNSWFTTYSGQYARIYINNTMKNYLPIFQALRLTHGLAN